MLTVPSRSMSTSIPRITGLPGGPNPQGWAAASGPTYAWPSNSKHEVCRSVVENLLDAVAECLAPHEFAC